MTSLTQTSSDSIASFITDTGRLRSVSFRSTVTVRLLCLFTSTQKLWLLCKSRMSLYNHRYKHSLQLPILLLGQRYCINLTNETYACTPWKGHEALATLATLLPDFLDAELWIFTFFNVVTKNSQVAHTLWNNLNNWKKLNHCDGLSCWKRLFSFSYLTLSDIGHCSCWPIIIL